MGDYQKIDLMPIGIKKQMRTIKKVGTCTAICIFSLLVVMWAAGVFHDLTTGIVLSLMLLLIIIPLLLPGLLFDKVSQSTMCFAADQIHIHDQKGSCWRSIDYNAITSVRVEEISGFFYGSNKDAFRNRYVCIFLNGLTAVPNVPFANLFTEKDFFMFAYHNEALNWVRQKAPN